MIIDGNNLAHNKYNLQGQPVTIAYDRAIIRDLAAWAKRQRQACSVDLFLDPRMVQPEPAARVFVHVAAPGERADPHIKDYVRHCVMSKKPCIVITDDDDLTEDASKQAVGVIDASEFIKFPNFLNLSRSDFEKESYPYLKPDPDAAHGIGDNAIRVSTNTSGRQAQKPSPIAASELLDAHLRTYQIRMAKPELVPAHSPDYSSRPCDLIPVKKQMVRLNLDTWPVEDGFQFLVKLICPQHKHEYQSLLGKPEQASSDDLRIFTHFVLELCSAEQDFYSRGVTLMDTVRLKLMKVYPDGLALAELEQLFTESPGFRNKIRVHNGKSIELFEITVLESSPIPLDFTTGSDLR